MSNDGKWIAIWGASAVLAAAVVMLGQSFAHVECIKARGNWTSAGCVFPTTPAEKEAK